jgi:hypothetical protein
MPGTTATLLEQYKLYVEMADRASARRQTVNSFFVGINTAVVAILGYVKTEQDPGTVIRFYWFVTPAGILFSYLWYRLIRSYRDLGTAKFKVIHELENHLPARPYHAEWEAVRRGQDPKLYRPFTHIEATVPRVFLCLYTIVLLWNIPWKIIAARLGWWPSN